jgi:REP element-mobilizing transposase RayT
MNRNSRKKLRLPDDRLYSNNNSFFVTICVQDRKCIFGDVTDGSNQTVGESPAFLTHSLNTTKMNLNIIGQIVSQEWLNTSNFYNNVELLDYVVMPNHFHGIITFLDTPTSVITGKITNLSKIIGTFKSVAYKKILSATKPSKGDLGIAPTVNSLETHHTRNYNETLDYLIYHYSTIWQKSFYDHVIRDEKDLNRVREYIFNNPLNWEIDDLNPKFPC